MSSFKMTKEEMIQLLKMLNEKLKKKELKGELLVFGGAVFCLEYESRDSTKDIDALFEPKDILRDLIKEIAHENNLVENWLNDGVKGWIYTDIDSHNIMEFSNLTVNTADPEVIFAMKCHSARFGEDENDINDIKFLVKYLNIKDLNEAYETIFKYIPRKLLKPKNQYVLEEVFEGELR